MDGGGWCATVLGVAESQTRLGDFTFFISIVPFGLEEAQAGIKIAGEIITSDMPMAAPLWQKAKKN